MNKTEPMLYKMKSLRENMETTPKVREETSLQTVRERLKQKKSKNQKERISLSLSQPGLP